MTQKVKNYLIFGNFLIIGLGMFISPYFMEVAMLINIVIGYTIIKERKIKNAVIIGYIAILASIAIGCFHLQYLHKKSLRDIERNR